MKVFSIEGPIGVGKSTTLGLLKQNGFFVYPEPTKEWEPWLQHFYTTEKTAKDSIHLQLQIGNSIVKRMETIVRDGNSVAIMERSLLSGLHVFTEVNKRLTPSPEWDNCVKAYEDLISKYETETCNLKIFYLALNCTDFEKVYQRSRLRGGPDSFTQVDYHKKIYDQSLKFHKKCHNVINFGVYDTPPVICDEIIKTINKHM